jgi:KGK domain
MIEFNIQIPRDVNLSPSTVISHQNGNQVFKISNFIEKLEDSVVRIQDQINGKIVHPYVGQHLKDYHCDSALTDGLVCEVLSPSSQEWRSGKLHANVKISFSVDFEFVEDSKDQAENSVSTLDDIRQSIEQDLALS